MNKAALLVSALLSTASAPPANVVNIAVGLKYADSETLVGASIVTDKKTDETILFDSRFQCLRWAMLKVALNKPRKLGFSCVPVPDVAALDKSHVVVDASHGSAIEDLAVAFEYGTTHQLVKTVLLGKAANDKECIKLSRETISTSTILPGWIVVIYCFAVPYYPEPSGQV